MRVEQIGDCTLYLADCMDVLPTLGRVDAVVTDPPYGMKWNGKVSVGKNGHGGRAKTKHYGVTILGDDVEFDYKPFLKFDKVILWGSNHYVGLPKGTTLVWIKRFDEAYGSYLSDAEVAWMKGGHGVYCKRDTTIYGESLNKLHPTQKPVGIMVWCLEKIGQAEIILDPFMGSGTTGVACVKMGRKFIGIEREQQYFDIACKRIDEAYRQPDMFIEQPKPKPEQLGLGIEKTD